MLGRLWLHTQIRSQFPQCKATESAPGPLTGRPAAPAERTRCYSDEGIQSADVASVKDTFEGVY